MSEPKKAEYWTTHPDAERFHCESIDDAMEEYLDDSEGVEELAKRGIKTVMVYGYAPLTLPATIPNPGALLEHVLEGLDDDYGDWGRILTAETPAMRRAAELFCEVVREEYEVCRYERVAVRKIDIHEWWAERHSKEHPAHEGADPSLRDLRCWIEVSIPQLKLHGWVREHE